MSTRTLVAPQVTGAGTLLRFALRRERIRIPIWVGALTLTTVSTVAGFPGLYPTAASRQARAALMENPAAIAMSGPGFGLGDYTYGAMLANEMIGFLAIARMRTEETSGRAEPVLSTALTRTGWVAGHLTVALTGGAAVMLACGLGLGLSATASTGDSSLLTDLLGAALTYVPAVWLATGLALTLFGLLPGAVHAAWAVLVYALFVGMLGPLLRLPGWPNDLSPFAHVPQLPAAEFTATPVVLLAAVAAGLVALGFAGVRQRDLESV